jgi:hypothetical protein
MFEMTRAPWFALKFMVTNGGAAQSKKSPFGDAAMWKCRCDH